MGESPQTADVKQAATTPAALRQLQDMPKDELEHLAEDLGIDHTAQRSIQHLVAAIHERRQMVEAMDREGLKNCKCVYLGNGGYEGEGCTKYR